MVKFTALLFFLLSVMMAGTLAQEPEGLGSRFFRVTVTMNEKPLLAGAIFEDTAGNLIVKGAPLAMVIARAYGVKDYQILAAPEWVYQSHLYDIEGLPPPEALMASDANAMLRALLAGRFKLQFTREVREVTAVVLDIDRAKQAELAREAEEARASGRATLPDVEALNRGVDAERAASLVRLGYIPVGTEWFIRGYERLIGEPIRDLTGKSGLYVRGARGMIPVLPEPQAFDILSAELAPSGIILERRNIPMEAIVITAIERPVLDAVAR